MTDESHVKTRNLVKSRLGARYAAETRFKFFGIAMVVIAILACFTLLFSILFQSLPAMTESRLDMNVNLAADKIDPTGSKNTAQIRAQGDFSAVVLDELVKKFPNAENDGGIDNLMEMVTPITITGLAKTVANNPDLIGTNYHISLALNDDLDLFLKKGLDDYIIKPIAKDIIVQDSGDGTIALNSAGAYLSLREAMEVKLRIQEARSSRLLETKKRRLQTLKDELQANKDNAEKTVELNLALSALEGEIYTDQSIIDGVKIALDNASSSMELNDTMPSLLVKFGGGYYKVNAISNDVLKATAIIPAGPTQLVTKGNASSVFIEMSQDGRPINDKMVAYGLAMKDLGLIKTRPNFTLFTHSDSNEPEMAGLLSAIVGSLLTLSITFAITVPIGILAAIYLEEFAPKNFWTDLIEVNINNLAAVPSIVFGLLGFSVFLHFFNMPRSAPVVGGIVLALMALPVVIIASRAALKAVPPSIREAALGVGASKVQSIFHHVLPLATPGMMTGSILAMAHALGETAPLLMIGMVAFIADVPNGIMDSATVLPVEVFMWAGRPERAWSPRTSAAIIILLLFMILMNAVAILLRKRFERRW